MYGVARPWRCFQRSISTEMKKTENGNAQYTPVAPTPYFLSHPYSSPENKLALVRHPRVQPHDVRVIERDTRCVHCAYRGPSGTGVT